MSLEESSDKLSEMSEVEFEEMISALSEPLIRTYVELTPTMRAYVQGYQDALSAVLRHAQGLEEALPADDR